MSVAELVEAFVSTIPELPTLSTLSQEQVKGLQAKFLELRRRRAVSSFEAETSTGQTDYRTALHDSALQSSNSLASDVPGWLVADLPATHPGIRERISNYIKRTSAIKHIKTFFDVPLLTDPNVPTQSIPLTFE